MYSLLFHSCTAPFSQQTDALRFTVIIHFREINQITIFKKYHLNVCNNYVFHQSKNQWQYIFHTCDSFVNKGVGPFLIYTAEVTYNSSKGGKSSFINQRICSIPGKRLAYEPAVTFFMEFTQANSSIKHTC